MPIKMKPFLLSSIGKDYIWGGNRLKTDFPKELNITPLAETWECSTHPDGRSIIASGEFKGKTLAEILDNYPEMLGDCRKTKGIFPILIKFIDAKENLSVQVHPSDEYAKENENHELGKSEMWYILDAEKDASLIYGFYRRTNKNEIRESIKEGTIEKYLQKIPVKKGDVFFIEAGTVHAIGAGILLAEIQENSNLTYRLYDYNRVDRNGHKRELHIEKALAVANFSGSETPRQPIRVLKYKRGCASELLCRCEYFEVYRMLLNTERCRTMVSYNSDTVSFRVLLCISGCGSLFIEKEEAISFFKGDCIFIPANSVNIKIHGKAEFLDIRG